MNSSNEKIRKIQSAGYWYRVEKAHLENKMWHTAFIPPDAYGVDVFYGKTLTELYQKMKKQGVL